MRGRGIDETGPE